jgi:hypothetical protein
LTDSSAKQQSHIPPMHPSQCAIWTPLTLKHANAELYADIARFSGGADDEMEVSPDGQSRRHQNRADGGGIEATDRDDHAKLSGESERIGTVDFDDDTPFGHRTAIV